MAVQKLIETTTSSVKITLYGFSEKDYARSIDFYWSEDGSDWNVYVSGSIDEGETECYAIKYSLDPGTTYYFKAVMTGNVESFTYGPYTVKTDGTSYNEMTGNCSIYGGGDSATISLTGVNTQAGYNRTVNLYYKKSSDAAYVLSDSKTISGSSYQSSFYYGIYGLEEKTSYSIKVEVLNPMGQTLKEWEKVVETGYATGGSLSVSGVTEKSCTLTVDAVPSSAKYPRSLAWYGKEGADGPWEMLTTTMAGAGNTYSLNTLIPLTYYGFKVEVSVGGELINTLTASCTTPEASGTLTEQETTEYSTKVLLSGLATGVSYVRKIKWFYRTSTESKYTQFEEETTLSQSASSAAMHIDTLASSTTYSIKAEIYDSSDRLLGSKTTIVTTRETVAEISFSSVTSASIKVVVSGMSRASYARTFEWWFKRQTDNDFVRFDATQLPATDETGTTNKVIKPLIAKTWYDFKVRIMKGSAVMKELTISARTALDNEIVPDTEISELYEEVGSKVLKVHWDAPEHEKGFFYRVQYSVDDDVYEDLGEVLSEPPADGYTAVELPELDKLYYIRVHSYYELDGELASKYSEPVTVWMYARFSWDTEKVQGQQFKLTAAEWNKLIKAINTRLTNEDITLENECTPALADKPVTALQFNQVCNAISTFNEVGITEQVVGNSITADMLNTLVSKVNLE